MSHKQDIATMIDKIRTVVGGVREFKYHYRVKGVVDIMKDRLTFYDIKHQQYHHFENLQAMKRPLVEILIKKEDISFMKPQKPLPDLPFKSSEFAEVWTEWMQYRKERKLAPYTPTGIKKTFCALVRDSNDDEQTAVEMINQSIEQNWQGIFPIKPKQYGTNSNIKSSSGNNTKPGRSEINDQARANY